MLFSKHEQEEQTMFDQQRIGANIMKARKAKGLTQMALADGLNVSFQAVSNWERGQTCPDLSNLMELSRLLDISVDALLGNERAAAITKEIAADKAPDLKPEELEQLAPLLTEEQADEAAENVAADFQTLSALAPYLSEEFLGEAALMIYKRTGDLNGVMGVVPFLDEDVVGELAEKIVEQEGAGALSQLAPFMDEDQLGDLVLKQSRDGTLKDLTPLLPFLNDDALCELTEQLLKKGDLKAILPLAPFLEEDILDEVARAILRGKQPSLLADLANTLKNDSGDC